ncbi:hypothetical protein QBZ16_001406 [Prototheca wickerhamii]|uniref:Uncharacterized protein n=1 Tax=Prototheca wickerhamii TaxID=3111 RepID=A0AAD9IG81_PROWI|nr:hypothetical protein QBZ16_001406 [Prototheca wickerhamii]
MEDPETRREVADARLLAAKASADATKRSLEYPTKSWGFWRSEKLNAHVRVGWATGWYETNADPAVKKMLGRALPDV